MIKRNVQLKAQVPTSAWRKLSFGMWSDSLDAQVVAPRIFNLKTNNAKEASVLFASAVSKATKEYPQVNSTLRLNKFYERKNVDIFFHVAGSPEPDNLTGLVIRRAEEKNLENIRAELIEGANRIRQGQDPLFSGIKRISWMIPSFLMRPVAKLLNFLMYDLNLWIPQLGMARDPFGSLMITNVGSLGQSGAQVPLPKFGSVGIIFCLGEFNKGKLPVNITFDHRRMDGAMAIEYWKRIQTLLDGANYAT